MPTVLFLMLMHTKVTPSLTSLQVQHIIHNFDISGMPAWPGDIKWTKDWGVPEILICCTEIPIEKGGLWGELGL